MRRLLIAFFCLSFVMTFSTAVLASSKGSKKGSAKKSYKGSEKGSMEKGSDKGSHKGSMAMGKETGATAIAYVSGTQAGSSIKGSVRFVETTSGVRVEANLTGVPDPGKHGFHIHQLGSCGNGGKAAGGHYNPSGTKHGYLPEDGASDAHAGDMGNLWVDGNGNGKLAVHLRGLTISGKNNVAGRAVILHAKPDDFGQPTGNAGGRIGCGTIAISKE